MTFSSLTLTLIILRASTTGPCGSINNSDEIPTTSAFTLSIFRQDGEMQQTSSTADPPNCHSQESPPLHVSNFDGSISYRTNVCEVQRAVWEDRVELPDALRGLNFNVVITNNQVDNDDKCFTLIQTDKDGKHSDSIAPHIRRDDSGLYAVILATRAGFT
jgi:hypothetical protein